MEKHKTKLNHAECERHAKAYYKTSAKMSIKHQPSPQLRIVLSMTSQHTRYKTRYQIGKYHLSCIYVSLSRQYHKDIYAQRNTHTQDRYQK